ncbi:Modulator of FtsH protease HflK [Rhodobacteraceae bacterium THAF1]|uniref:FtsH protease activity modulator HflK n=1 Tax=Palleronia sp. THAF1 TaxID=2587842 RepID=UPI000F3BE019|nr:FtsH protease activity modulator HflK [Palleronia sp. THAF1]QFU07457.1 Modulator of FtsH protease HflK [Palleronia sp. THAF1]VDC20631.1 Modulator of FtsH protease HflK [Rhodobacteraceae bacterium THAF1]
MANNNGGPWGGGGNRGGNDGGDRRPPNGQRPNGQGGGQVPDIDEIVNRGKEQLRVLMGGKGRPNTGGGGSGGEGPGRGVFIFAGIALVGLWLFASFYRVNPEEQSVELFLGEYSSTGEPGLNFAPWPLVTHEVLPVTREQTEELGVGRGANSGDGLMLTTDANIVDIDFEVVWNIRDPAQYLFNLAEPVETIRSVSESAMREVIARSELAPILNRDRDEIAASVTELIQTTLDSYESGVNILRLNLDKADPPVEVIDAFRDVQAAEQERDRLQRQADAYANQVLAGARGQAAQLLEEAEAYRAQQVNEAEGEASRFSAVLTEYQRAPQVTRKRLYLETMERVLGDIDKVILDEQGGAGGQGVVPYLPLNELTGSRNRTATTTNTNGASN